jgi:hypothetical protein
MHHSCRREHQTKTRRCSWSSHFHSIDNCYRRIHIQKYSHNEWFATLILTKRIHCTHIYERDKKEESIDSNDNQHDTVLASVAQAERGEYRKHLVSYVTSVECSDENWREQTWTHTHTWVAEHPGHPGIRRHSRHHPRHHHPWNGEAAHPGHPGHSYQLS